MKIAQARQVILEDADRLDATNVEKASRYLREAVGDDPENPAVLLHAAQLSYRLKDEDATMGYVRALEPVVGDLNDPVLVAAMLHLFGALAEDRGELSKAVGALRNAVDLDPEEIGYVVALAGLLSKSGHDEEAAEIAQRAQVRWPGHPSLNAVSGGAKRRVRVPVRFARSPSPAVDDRKWTT